MKKRIRIIMTLVLFICIFSVNSISVHAALKISRDAVTIVKGNTYQLKIKGTKKSAKWVSKKKSIASVSAKGKIKAKKKGTCTIVAKVNGKKYRCKINVINSVSQKQAERILKIRTDSYMVYYFDESTSKDYIYWVRSYTSAWTKLVIHKKTGNCKESYYWSYQGENTGEDTQKFNISKYL